MSNGQCPHRSESIRYNPAFNLELERHWRPLRPGLGKVSRHRLVKLVALLSLLSWGAGISGCEPSETNAKPPAKPVASTQPSKSLHPRQDKPAVARATKKLPRYVLPFEARANPFARPRPKSEPGDQSNSNGTLRAPDVKLLGLLWSGAPGDGKNSMAVAEVDGQQHVVYAGTVLKSPSYADGLHIVQIRKSDIVVEQGGRKWVVPLSQP